MKYVVALISLFFGFGCSNHQPTWVDNIVAVQTPKQQAVQSLSTKSTSFFVEYSDDAYAWERAQLFFTNYTSSIKPVKVRTQAYAVLSNAEQSLDRYFYKVQKKQRKGGYKYIVQCWSNKEKGSPRAAQLNAKNLSEFIQSGNLEVSVLDH